MRYEDIKLGQKVADYWFLDWGTGVVKAILKTRVVVWFPGRTVTYDKAHLRFIEDHSTREVVNNGSTGKSTRRRVSKTRG